MQILPQTMHLLMVTITLDMIIILGRTRRRLYSNHMELALVRQIIGHSIIKDNLAILGPNHEIEDIDSMRQKIIEK